MWIDRRDIPPTAEWRAEIEDGIRVETPATPDSVRARQWLAGDDPDALARWLVSDPDRVRLHTRILTQAWEWQARGRRRSALLREQDLRRAQQWLDRHDTADDPSPTGLQRDYLGASRVASRQRVAAGEARRHG